jgi:hypothetical protein
MNPNQQANGAHKDATPFVAMILFEVLELHAICDAHGLILQALMKEKGMTGEQAFAGYKEQVRGCRRHAYDKLEAKIREIWPDHLALLKTLYRDT